MKNTSKTVVIILGFTLIAGAALLYGLFHGYFDRGKFEVKQIQWSSAKQVAMVVERSDQQALSGYTYFVLIGDHVFSPSELQREYHSNAVIFAATDSCLDLHWQRPSKLVVTCNSPNMTREHIDVEKYQSGGVTIIYDNIPSQ